MHACHLPVRKRNKSNMFPWNNHSNFHLYVILSNKANYNEVLRWIIWQIVLYFLWCQLLVVIVQWQKYFIQWNSVKLEYICDIHVCLLKLEIDVIPNNCFVLIQSNLSKKHPMIFFHLHAFSFFFKYGKKILYSLYSNK